MNASRELNEINKRFKKIKELTAKKSNLYEKLLESQKKNMLYSFRCWLKLNNIPEKQTNCDFGMLIEKYDLEKAKRKVEVSKK